MKKKIFIIMIMMMVLFTSMGTANTVLAVDKQANESIHPKVIVPMESKIYWCGNEEGMFGFNTWNAFDILEYALGIKLIDIGEPKLAEVEKAKPAPVKTETQPAASAAPANDTVQTQAAREKDPEVSRGGGRTITVVATGYTDAPEENYPWAGYPSYIGLPLARGIVAVDPNVIPMGSKLYIEGYGEGIAADQGGAIKGNRIDLFFDTKNEAYDWGMRSVKVTVYP